MNFFDYKNKKIAYSDEGQGEPLVLIHGFCEDASMWDEFIEYIKADYRVIRPDMPGFGQSDVWEGVSIEDIAESTAALLDHLSIDRSVVIGHSMGGYASLAFAKKYPQKLKGLGIFHSHPYADSEATKDLRAKSIEFMQRQGHALYVKQLMRRLFPAGYSNEVLINAMTYKAVQYPTEGIKAGQAAMMNRINQEDTLRHVQCPVLFILGKRDDLIPFEQSLEQTYLPQRAMIHILPKIGHMGMFEDKDRTEKIVRDFLVFCEG